MHPVISTIDPFFIFFICGVQTVIGFHHLGCAVSKDFQECLVEKGEVAGQIHFLITFFHFIQNRAIPLLAHPQRILHFFPFPDIPENPFDT